MKPAQNLTEENLMAACAKIAAIENFRRSQARLGVSNKQLAQWLDCAPEHISRMRTGTKRVTKLTQFALKALESGLRPDPTS